jgi:small subunit ribosomal protein S16
MVKIIFSRTGKKKQAYFRLIVIDKLKDPWGRNLENLGNYDPHTKELVIKEDRLKYWLSKGAQPSATIHNLLIEKKIIEGKKQRKSSITKRRLVKMNAKTKAADDAKAAKDAKNAAATAEAPKAPEAAK